MENDDKQGTIAGIPYDVRKPTVERYKNRAWSAEDPRLFPPKSFGWGYGVNFYWLFHPAKYFRNRRG